MHVPDARIHSAVVNVPDEFVNIPDAPGVWVKVTLPVGTTAVPGEVSVTEITQLVGVLGGEADGVQTTEVDVDLCTAVIARVGEELPE